MISHPDLIKAALTADALSLGPHWVYDQSALAKAYPAGVHEVTAPLSQYHPGKTAGDFTHYGDNLVLMLEAVSDDDGWNEASFSARWREFWSDTSSYRDGATRTTLARLEDPTQSGSTSNDIAGASIALILTGLIGNTAEADLIAAVRERTGFAHLDPETLDAAEFFTRVIGSVRTGSSLADALVAAAGASYESLDAGAELAKAQASLDSDAPLKAAAGFGLTCHTPDAFPLVLYCLLRNPSDISAALSENALAGGDNAARAIIIALVLTAANGWDGALDHSWKALNRHGELTAMLEA